MQIIYSDSFAFSHILDLSSCVSVSHPQHHTDAPEISVDQPTVFTGESAEAQLSCTVEGISPPEVRIVRVDDILYTRALSCTLQYVEEVYVHSHSFSFNFAW